jgi:type II secretory pathway pseudopilin PulG
MHVNTTTNGRPGKGALAFTLAEVAIALAIIGMLFGGGLLAYTQAIYRAQWSGYSLAADALAIQQIEQARCAVWDPSLSQNQVTNLNLLSMTSSGSGNTYVQTGYCWTNLDLPTTGTNFVRATNFVTVKMLYYNTGSTTLSNISVQLVRVDTVWPFRWKNQTSLFTNTICTYLAPDNRDPSTID